MSHRLTTRLNTCLNYKIAWFQRFNESFIKFASVCVEKLSECAMKSKK